MSSLTLDASSPYPWIIKDPGAKLDYSFDWSSWLGPDTIATATWTADPVLALSSQTLNATSTSASCFVAGGNPGCICHLTCAITTTQGRQDSRTIELRITPR